MWNAFQQYSALDPEARKLFRRAATLLPLIVISLRFRGFSKTKERLQAKSDAAAPPEITRERAAETLERTCRMVEAASRHGAVRATCLEESLALWYLLKKQGVMANLRIGVRKPEGKFEAHAWVEYDGAALSRSEQLHRHYAAFDSEFSELPGKRS